MLDEEEDGANLVERGDGTAGDDGEIGGEGGDGDEAEVGLAREELPGAEGGLRGVQGVTGGEGRVLRWVFEVPHERGWVEEVDGGNAEFGWRGQKGRSQISLKDEEGRLLVSDEQQVTSNESWATNLETGGRGPQVALLRESRELRFGDRKKSACCCLQNELGLRWVWVWMRSTKSGWDGWR